MGTKEAPPSSEDMDRNAARQRVKNAAADIESALAGAPTGNGGGAAGQPAPGQVQVAEPWTADDLERTLEGLVVGLPKAYLNWIEGLDMPHLPMEDEVARELAQELAPVLQHFIPKGHGGGPVVHGINATAILAQYTVSVAFAVKTARAAQEPDEEEPDVEVSESGGIRRKGGERGE